MKTVKEKSSSTKGTWPGPRHPEGEKDGSSSVPVSLSLPQRHSVPYLPPPAPRSQGHSPHLLQVSGAQTPSLHFPRTQESGSSHLSPGPLILLYL